MQTVADKIALNKSTAIFFRNSGWVLFSSAFVRYPTVKATQCFAVSAWNYTRNSAGFALVGTQNLKRSCLARAQGTLPHFSTTSIEKILKVSALDEMTIPPKIHKWGTTSNSSMKCEKCPANLRVPTTETASVDLGHTTRTQWLSFLSQTSVNTATSNCNYVYV